MTTIAQVREDAWAGKYLFVYLTPELAVQSIAALQNLHSQRGICLVAVDEAHCVSGVYIVVCSIKYAQHLMKTICGSITDRRCPACVQKLVSRNVGMQQVLTGVVLRHYVVPNGGLLLLFAEDQLRISGSLRLSVWFRHGSG